MIDTPTPSPLPSFNTAPLVNLVLQDPSKMSREELERYLANIRTMRSSSATARAKTERAPRKSKPVNTNLIDDL